MAKKPPPMGKEFNAKMAAQVLGAVQRLLADARTEFSFSQNRQRVVVPEKIWGQCRGKTAREVIILPYDKLLNM